MSATRAAITAADEEPHAPSTDLAWREAYAFDLHDAASGLAGFTRMTVRPNAGMMDAALSFFLPDGGFITARHVKPQSTNTAELEVEDVRYTVCEPLRSWRVTYDGPAHSLLESRDAGDRAAWARSRLERLIVDVTLEATSPPLASGAQLFQQTCVARGEVWVSGDHYVLQALGGRERCWGVEEDAQLLARSTLLARFDERHALGVTLALRDQRPVPSGWIVRDGAPLVLVDATLATTREPETDLPSALRLTLKDEQGEQHVVTGEVVQLAPLPEMRNARASVSCECVVRYRWQERVGYGFATDWRVLDANGKPVASVG